MMDGGTEMNGIQRVFPLAVLLTSLLLVAGQASAQMGGVRGIVFDEEGNPLAGVEIVIELEGGGRSLTTTTNKDGQFVKGGIRVGSYTLSYFLDGYEEITSQVQVSFGKPQQLDDITMARLPEGTLTTRGAEEAQEMLNSAVAAQQAGDIDATIANLQAFLEKVPDSAPAYFNIGAAYETKGDIENATANYNKAVELDPMMLDAWLALGDLNGKLKKWPEGMEALGKALEIKPDQPIVLFNYGAYAFNAGDIDVAQGAFQKLVDTDPNHALGHYRLGLTYVSQGNSAEAINHIEKFIELAPDSPNVPAAKNLLATLKQG